MNDYSFVQTIEDSYKEADDGEFSTLSVLLTPMDLLKSDERYTRARLYQIDSGEIELDIVQDRFNEYDSKTLEVYYDKTFIGYVRKQFYDEYIDNTDVVDVFCFYEGKFRDIKIYWNGDEYILKSISFEKVKKLKEEKEDLLKTLYEYRDIMPGKSLSKASSELQNDKELVLAYIGIDGNELEDASEVLKKDKDVVLTAIKNARSKGKLIKYFVHKDLLKSKEFILELIDIVPRYMAPICIECASKELKNDRDLVLKAIKNNGCALEYGSKDLKNDKNIILAAVSNKGNALQYASLELQNNRAIVLAAVSNEGNALQYASKALKNDKNIILAAVSNKGNALQYASLELQNNRAIVLAAVSNEGNALQYASKALKNDKDIILRAISQDGSYFEYADDLLKKNRDFCWKALKESDEDQVVLVFFSLIEKYRNDIDFILFTLKKADYREGSRSYSYWNYNIVEAISMEVLKNKTFLKEALENKFDILPKIAAYCHRCEHNEEHYQEGEDYSWIYNIEDGEVIFMAYKQFGARQLEFANESLLGNKEFILSLLSIENKSSYILDELGKELRDDIDIVFAAVSQNGYDLRNATKEMQCNKIIVMKALEYIANHNTGNLTAFLRDAVCEKLKDDKDLISKYDSYSH